MTTPYDTPTAKLDRMAVIIQAGRLAQQSRDELIRDLREDGWPIDDIAMAAGLTKQRISQIVNKR